MAAPQTPQAGSNGPRRPRAWLARRAAAVLSVAAMLGLGGLMYWNDQQGTTTAQAATAASSTSSSSSASNSTNRSDRERSGDDDGEHESEGDDEGDGGSIVDDIANLIPGLSSNSGSSNSSNSSSSGTPQQTVPAPHTNTRGS